MDDATIIQWLQNDPPDEERGAGAMVDRHVAPVRNSLQREFGLDTPLAEGLAFLALERTMRRIMDGLTPEKGIRAYMLTAARNAARRHITRHPDELPLHDDVLDTGSEWEVLGEATTEDESKTALEQAVWEALNALSPRDRRAIELMLQGCEGREFAEALGVSAENARQIRSRAKTRAEKILRPIVGRLRPHLLGEHHATE